LTELPEWVGQLTQLRNLNIWGNQVRELPESLIDLKLLENLDVFRNHLTNLPEVLGKLPQLRVLDVGENRLARLPDWLGQLTRLQVLKASKNNLAILPESLGQLKQLQGLRIDGNKLTALPESLGQLAKLQGLDVRSNQLSSLPQSLSRLTRLKHLWAGNNRLTSLPESLRALLASLDGLELHGNDRLGFPSEILGTPWEQSLWQEDPFLVEVKPPPVPPATIVDYYFRTRQHGQPLNEAKLILVGRGGVGKTCLIKRLIHNTFNEHEPETPGIEIQPWEVALPQGDSVRLHVWDFGGQEILHATHQFFLTERTLYLLVLSGREGNPTQDAEYWLQFIRSFGGDSRVVIVLNKAVQHPFDVNRGLLLEKYPLIAGFRETDCENASGVQELKEIVLRQTETLEHRKVTFPADWFSIKERLAGMTESFITWDQYQDICRSLGEQDSEAQRQLAGFLHILGIALNYSDDPRLRDTHVLNPRWVTEGIYSLLRAGQKKSRMEGLTRADVASVLDKTRYPISRHAFLLHLMEKFQLCFRLPGGEERYLVPELLGENQPDLGARLTAPGLGFRYQYEVLPEGLLPRFIVQTHAHSEGSPRWRTGVILRRDGCEAVVRADSRERRVDIHITGSEAQRRGLLAIIREKFDEQHGELKGLTVDERVPVLGEQGVTVSYSHLLLLEEDREEWCRPEGTRQKVRVADLLNGVESLERREQRRIQSLREESGDRARVTTAGDRSREKQIANINIGIITALPEEFAAMKALLRDCQDYNVPGPGAGRSYVLGWIPSRHGGEHRVALAMADMGNNIATARATLLLEHFHAVDAIIMAGIAGGVPSPQKPDDHVRLGDIVVSDKRGVVQYDMVKLKMIRACPIAPSARLLEAVRRLQADELAGNRPWDEHIAVILQQLKQKRPPQTTDKLHATDDPEVMLKHPNDPKRLVRRPRVFLGPVASANELLKDPVKRDSLRDKFGVKAVEMEGSGIADATWNHDKGYLVVRGTCDYCDAYKNDDWHGYAAAVAASYTRTLIESIVAPKLSTP
jgi:internalin A